MAQKSRGAAAPRQIARDWKLNGCFGVLLPDCPVRRSGSLQLPRRHRCCPARPWLPRRPWSSGRLRKCPRFILRMYYAENIIQDLSNTFNLYDHTNRIHSSIVTVYLDRIQYIQPPGIHVHSGIQECFCFLLQFRVIGQLIRAFCVDGIHGFGFCLCLCAGSRPAGAGCEQQHPPMSTPMCQNFVQNRAEITQFHHVWVVK